MDELREFDFGGAHRRGKFEKKKKAVEQGM